LHIVAVTAGNADGDNALQKYNLETCCMKTTKKSRVINGGGDGNGENNRAPFPVFLENDDFRQITTKLPDLLRYKKSTWRLAA